MPGTVRSGLLLLVVCGIVAGSLYFAQSTVATPQAGERATIVPVQQVKIVTKQPTRLEKIQRLAETDHVALLKMALAEYDSRNIRSYTCRFIKQEKLRGKLHEEQHVDVKFHAEPFSVSMTWVKNAPKADAILYVDGKYQDSKGRSQMVVRPTSGFLQWLVGGSVLRLPDGDEVMQNTLKPCTQFGFRNTLLSLIEVYESALARGECEMKFAGVAKVDGHDCIVIERHLPYRPEYPAMKTVVYMELDNLLPLEICGYDWKGELTSHYAYHNVNLAADLDGEDFTPKANGIKGH